MKRIYFSILTTVTLALAVDAQEVKFRKISKEALEETSYSRDAEAHGAYLYRNIKIHYDYSSIQGFRQIKEVHERIKIYDKDGLGHATQKIVYFNSSKGQDKISGLKGYTYNLVDGKIEDSKLKSDGIFDEEINKYWSQRKFTFPDVKAGSIIEFKYSIASPYTTYIDELPMQFFIPVKEQHIKMVVPEYYGFKPIVKGYLPLRPSISSGRGSIEWVNKQRAEGFGGGTTKFKNQKVEFQTTVTKYDMTDVPALKPEPYVNNMRNYLSSVKYEIQYTKYPNSPIKSYTKDWEKVAKEIYSSESFGGQLKKTAYYEDDLNALLSNVSKPDERMAKVFSFVKSKVKWNGNNGYSSRQGVRKAYKEGVGNVGDINLMMVSMLSHANLKAYPVLVSTRDHGIPLFPTIEGFNYVIAAVKMGGQIFLLDATSPNSVPNVLPNRALNWMGRLITKDGNSTPVNLMPQKRSLDAAMFSIAIDKDGSIEGKCRQQLSDHNALVFRDKYAKKTEEEFIEDIEKDNDIEISDFQLKSAGSIYKPVLESFSFSAEDQFDVIDGSLYIAPMFHMAYDENPFKLDHREYPVDFGYPQTDKRIINIEIPEGYDVQSMPESVSFSMPEKLGSFKYNIMKNGNMISLSSVLDINTSIVSPDRYSILKEFFRQIVEKQSEKVVLKKI